MTPALSRAAFGARVLLVRLRFVALMIAVALLVAFWDDLALGVARRLRPAPAVTPATPEHEFFCPMHPLVVRGEPGECPSCHMPLARRKRGAPDVLPADVVARVSLSPYRLTLANVGTSPAHRRALARRIDAVGTIELDERRVARIAARVAGRVEKAHVDAVGVEVKQGAPLVQLWSQELWATSRELVLARGAGGPALEAARQRLLRWGLGQAQVEAIERSGEASPLVEVAAPIAGTVLERRALPGEYVEEGTVLYSVADLGALWMVARVHEDDAPLVRLGQEVEIRAAAWPERVFAGHVSFVAPVVDPRSRTIAVRVDVPNEHRLLRPGLSVRAGLSVPLGPDGGPRRPATAVVWRCCSACPTIEAGAPGTCPQCGMALTPVERPATEALAAGAWLCRCAMHPDEVVRAAAPGACRLCGAALVREGDPEPEPVTITVFECPGHPEQTRDRAIPCPRCAGMVLEPRELPAAEARALLARAAAARGEERAGSLPAPADVAPVMSVYECPSHPDETRDHPDICRPCGTMDLIPRQVPRAEGEALARRAAQARGEERAGSRPAPADAAAVMTIYECGGHPDETRDHPDICRPCGTMQLIPRQVPRAEGERIVRRAAQARGEAVAPAPAEAGEEHPLVVPIDAVVDTGGRQLVWVETSSGVFDAHEVVVGPRVGEWAPVLRGLRDGQRVVTRGAFLVDAEARLSPAAASTYFGASGR